MSEGHIYVLCHNRHTEGYAPPMQAFASWADALHVRDLMNASGIETYEIFDVPVWPRCDADARRKPVAPAEPKP